MWPSKGKCLSEVMLCIIIITLHPNYPVSKFYFYALAVAHNRGCMI